MKNNGKNTKNESKKKVDTTIHNMAKADFEMRDAMEDAGMKPKTYGIWGIIWKISERFGRKEKKRVKKKTYILLTIFTGFFGGHRFYTGRYILGVIYLAFFWTIIPFMMAVLDLLEVIPMKADEDGMVMM